MVRNTINISPAEAPCPWQSLVGNLPDLNATHEPFCLVFCPVPLGERGEQLHEEPSLAPSSCCSVTVGHGLGCAPAHGLCETVPAHNLAHSTKHSSIHTLRVHSLAHGFSSLLRCGAQRVFWCMACGAPLGAQLSAQPHHTAPVRGVPQSSAHNSGHNSGHNSVHGFSAWLWCPPLRQGPLPAPLLSPPLCRAPLPAWCPWSRAARGA